MPLLLFGISHLLAAGLIVAAGCVLGRRLLRPMRFDSFWEALSISAAIGLGSIGTGILLLGLCGLLYRSSVLALLLACHGLGWTSWRSAIRRVRAMRLPRRSVPRFALLALAALLVGAPLVWRALYPPTQFDATLYHLASAREFAVSHRVAPLPAMRFVVFPQLNEMLFAAALLLSDDLAAQLVELFFLALVCAAMVGWARRSGTPRAGLWAAALWLGSPLVLYLATAAYVEIAVAAFATVALYAFSCWTQTEERGWLIVSGLSAGFAAGTKYSGLFFVGAIFAAVLLRALRRRGWAAPLLLAASAAAAGPWYARNMICAGSPVWPFLGEVFGYRFWTARDVASVEWSLRSYGWPRTVASFVALPWNIAIHPHASEAPLFGISFLLLPLSAIVALRDARTRWLPAWSLGYLLFWFLTSQQLRFLVPILPVLSLMTANAGERLVARLSDSWRRPLGVSCAAALVLFAAPALARQYAGMAAEGAPPRTQGERDAYLGARFPSYRCYADLNARFGDRYTIYAFHDESMKYYARGTQLGDWFGFGRYSDVALDNGRGLRESLERLGAQFLLVNQGATRTELPRDPDFDSRFRPICRNGPVTVYAVR